MTKMYFAENPDAKHDIHDLLSALEFNKKETLLDVGCGYGTLGLTLAKAQELEVTLVDINQRALDLARKNAAANQVSADIFQSNVYEQVTGQFHHIISNPPIRAGKQVVHEVISGSYDHLLADGDLTIVIQKKQGAPSAKAKMEEVFGNCETLKKDKGYYILRSVK